MNNKMLATVIGLAVCIILTGSVLAPVIEDAQTITSTEINHTNDSSLFKMAEADETVTISLAGGTVTLNGAPVPKISNSNILLSDAISLDQFIYQGNWLNRAWFVDGTSLVYPTAFDLVFDSGRVTGTFTTGGETSSIDMAYTYIYYEAADGDLTQFSSQAGIDFYVNTTDDVVLSGLYYGGSNATTYAYINGELTIDGDYEAAITFESEQISKDLVHVTGVTVTVGDETFTPYRYMAPTKVISHEETPTSGLIGVIPVMVIVAILASVAFAVFRGARD